MDDFEEEYEDEQDSGNSLADDINDAKDTYDDFKEYYNKYKDYKSSQSTSNPQISEAPTNGTPPPASATPSSGGTVANSTTALTETGANTATAVSETAAAGGTTAASGAAASGAAAGGAAAGGTAAGGAAAGGAAAAGPPGWIAAAVILLLGGLKKEIEKRKKESTDEKVKHTIRDLAPLLVLAGIIILPVIFIVFIFSAGYTVTTYDSVERVDEFITCLESDSTCSEITDLDLQEKVDGYGKPLVLFTKSELIEAAETYSKFSQKYFETGEGFFTDEYTQVKEDFGIDEDYDLKKEELDSAVLANFFSLEARAFSKIDWIEVTWDNEKNCAVEKKIEDFDVFYDSSKDISNPRSWFAWLSPEKEEDYVIKIPSVKKYSVTKTKVEVLSSTVNGEVTEEEGSVNNYQNPTDDQITDEYKQTILKSYINMVKEYLPQWYEPYSVYLATGDVKYAKKFYQKYLNLITSSEFKITVKLFFQEIKTNVKDDVTLETSKEINGTTTTETTNKHRETDTTTSRYTPIVFSGAGFNSILEYVIIDYYKEENVKEELKHDKNPQVLSSGPINDEDGKQIGKYTTTQIEKKVETVHKYRIVPKKLGEHRFNYTSLYDEKYKDIYIKNDYANLRLAYVYYKICQDDNIDFNIDNIGPALEVVKEYYGKSRNISNSTTIPGTSNGVGNTYSSPVQSGEIDKEKRLG